MGRREVGGATIVHLNREAVLRRSVDLLLIRSADLANVCIIRNTITISELLWSDTTQLSYVLSVVG